MELMANLFPAPAATGRLPVNPRNRMDAILWWLRAGLDDFQLGLIAERIQPIRGAIHGGLAQRQTPPREWNGIAVFSLRRAT